MDVELKVPGANQDRILLLTAATFFGGTEALRDFLLQLKPEFKNPDDFKICLSAKKDELDLQFEDQKLLVFPYTGLPDINKFDISLLAKVIFSCTDFALEELRDKLLEHEPRLADTKYFKQCVEKAKKHGKDELSPAEKSLMCPVTEEPDIQKLDIFLLRRFKKFCTNCPKEAKHAFDINHLDLEKKPPKGDYGYVHLMEKLRNEFAHWGGKEISEEAYRKYWDALQKILEKLKFDVKMKLKPFKSGIVTSDGAILRGEMLALYARLQDRLHDLESKLSGLEKTSSDVHELKKEVNDLSVTLTDHATKITAQKTLTEKTAEVLRQDLKNTNKDVEKLSTRIGNLEKRVENLESRVEQLEVKPKSAARLSQEELSNKKHLMQEEGLEWANSLTQTDPFSGRQYKIEALRVDPVLVESPAKDVSRVEERSTHKIPDMFKSERQRIVEYQDIFDKNRSRVTFVLGVAGSGKSVLSVTLYRLWCEAKLLKEFNFVIMLRARDLNAKFSCGDSQCTVDDVLQTDLAFLKCDVSLERLLSSTKQILFVIDGLDESDALDELAAGVSVEKWPNTTPLGKGLVEVFSAVRRGCSILFLGRHTACMELEKACQTQHIGTRKFELAGYSSEKITKYVSNFAGGRKDVESRLMDFLNESPNLMSLVSIPLYLWVFCSVYSNSEVETCPRTETELLINMLLSFTKKHARVNKGESLSRYEFHELLKNPELAGLVTILSEVAYDNLRKNELKFAIEDHKLARVLNESGLFIAMNTAMCWRGEFQHKLLQELLAAAYIATHADIQAKDVISNTFLRPCLPMLCAFEGAQLERSQSPWLIKEFVTKMLRPRKENRTHDEFIRCLYERVKITSPLLRRNDAWITFLSCYKEYSNLVHLEPCINGIDCIGMSSRELDQVKYLLGHFSETGFVRNLSINIDDDMNIKDIKEWLLLCRALSQAPIDKRLVELIIRYEQFLERTGKLESIIQLGHDFTFCHILDVELIHMTRLAEVLGVCRPQSDRVTGQFSQDSRPKLSMEVLRRLVSMEFDWPARMSNLRLMTYSSEGVHLQYFRDDLSHLTKLSNSEDEVGGSTLFRLMSLRTRWLSELNKKEFSLYRSHFKHTLSESINQEFREHVSSLKGGLNFFKFWPAGSKKAYENAFGPALNGFEFGPDDCSTKHNFFVHVLPTHVFLEILKSCGGSISPDLAHQWGKITRLLLTEENLSLSAWLILLSRIFDYGRRRLLLILKPSVDSRLDFLDLRKLVNKFCSRPNNERNETLSFDIDNFSPPANAGKGDYAWLMASMADAVVTMGPGKHFCDNFSKYWELLDVIFEKI